MSEAELTAEKPRDRRRSLKLRCIPYRIAHLFSFRSLDQGRNEVRRPPWARSNFGAHFFIESKCIVLKQVLVTLLGLFGAPRSDSAPGELCPP